MLDVFPTADEVAVVIVAASRETGASPLDVATGQLDYDGGPHGPYRDFPIARARYYAARTLAESFRVGAPACSRMCGVGTNSYHTFLPSTDHRIRTGKAQWFNANILKRVKRALVHHQRYDIRPKVLQSLAAPSTINHVPSVVVESIQPKPKSFTTCAPSVVVENVTAHLMGDPPLERSALASYIERQMQK